VRKFIIPLVLLAAILFGSNQSFATATLYYKLVTPTANTWQIWVEDADLISASDLGINGFGVTLTPSSGNITLNTSGGSQRWSTAPLGTYNGGVDPVDLGFTSASASPTTAYGANGQVLIAQQGTLGSVAIDAAILHVGQNAMSGTGFAGNNNGHFLADADPVGDTIDVKRSWSTSNLAGFVMFFSGTNSVGGAITTSSIAAAKGAVFLAQAQQPLDTLDTNDPPQPILYSAIATTDPATVLLFGAAANASTLTLSPTALVLRAMQGGSATKSATLTDTHATNAAGFIATSTAQGTVSPASGTVAANNGTQGLTLGWASYATTGARAATITATNTSNAADPFNTGNHNISLTGAVVANRVVQSSPAPATYLNMLKGSVVSTALTLTSTSNDDNSFTRVTVANGTDGTFTVSGGNPAMVFNGTNYQNARTLSGQLNSFGNIANSFNLTTTGEGLTGEIPINVAVSYSAVNVGLATSSSGSRSVTSTALTGSGAGGAYAGLASRTTVGGTTEGTTAQLLAGVSSSGLNVVSMAWRDQYNGMVAAVVGSELPETTLLLSDVVKLSGMNKTGALPLPDGRVQADPFVLQMSYHPAVGTTNGTPIWIDYLNLGTDNALGGAPGPAHDLWTDAVSADLLPGSIGSLHNGDNRFLGSWTTFITTGPGTGHTLSQLVGAEGYDPTTTQTWAVLDYNNAQFAVVPMPIALWSGLVTLGGLAVTRFVRRRKQSGEF
jgi:hypothetical protein